MQWFSRLSLGLALTALLGGARISRADDASAGKPLYTKNCVVCHGVKGTGNGPSGRGLNPRPTDLSAATPDDAVWFKAIKLGTHAVGKSSGMQGFAKVLTDDQIRDVIAYAKTFKAPGTSP